MIWKLLVLLTSQIMLFSMVYAYTAPHILIPVGAGAYLICMVSAFLMGWTEKEKWLNEHMKG